MVAIPALLFPILLGAVLVFVVSSIIHMLLPYHRSDFGKIAGEDDLMEAMRKIGVKPGDYVMPHAGSPENMKKPDYQEKVKKGPIAFVSVLSDFGMGKSLVLWFVYSVVVNVLVAYVAGRTLGPGADYMTVFRLTGTVAFIAYSVALWQNSIWYKRPWLTTAKQTFDGLVYGLVTAGAFGWLWP